MEEKKIKPFTVWLGVTFVNGDKQSHFDFYTFDSFREKLDEWIEEGLDLQPSRYRMEYIKERLDLLVKACKHFNKEEPCQK